MLPENSGLKLRYILWPYLRALVVLAAGWAGVNALLFAYLPLFEPAFWLWSVAAPIVLAALAMWQLWPGLLLVEARKEGRNSYREFVMLLVFVLLAFTGGYIPGIVKATVSRPIRLAHSPYRPGIAPAHYYVVSSFQVDTRQAGCEAFQRNHNGTISYFLYVACPVWADTTRKEAPLAWVRFRYIASHHYTQDSAAEAALFRQFKQANLQTLTAERAHLFDHLKHYYPDSDINEGEVFSQAMQRSPGYRATAAPPLLLLPVAESLPSQARTSLQELGKMHLFGNALLLILLLAAPLDPPRKLALTSRAHPSA